MQLHDIGHAAAHRHTNLKVQISVWKSISSYIQWFQSGILERLIWNYHIAYNCHFSWCNLCPLHELCVEWFAHKSITEVKHSCNVSKPFLSHLCPWPRRQWTRDFCFVCVLALFVHWNTEFSHSYIAELQAKCRALFFRLKVLTSAYSYVHSYSNDHLPRSHWFQVSSPTGDWLLGVSDRV